MFAERKIAFRTKLTRIFRIRNFGCRNDTKRLLLLVLFVYRTESTIIVVHTYEASRWRTDSAGFSLRTRFVSHVYLGVRSFGQEMTIAVGTFFQKSFEWFSVENFTYFQNASPRDNIYVKYLFPPPFRIQRVYVIPLARGVTGQTCIYF